jgi:hypothetical protein
VAQGGGAVGVAQVLLDAQQVHRGLIHQPGVGPPQVVKGNAAFGCMNVTAYHEGR